MSSKAQTIVSVVIPVLNDHRIARALDSVFGQDLPDDIKLQVIVVDDSDDDTGQLLLQYGDRIEVTSTPGGPRGLYVARNQGINLARGDFISFIGADDEYADPRVVADLVRLFDATLDRRAPGFAQGWINMVDPNGPSVHPPRGSKEGVYEQGWILPDLATLWTRAVFDRYGCYDERFLIAGDHELFRRIILSHDIPHVQLDRVVTLMEVGGISTRDSLKDELRAVYELWLSMRAHPALPAPFAGHHSFPLLLMCRVFQRRLCRPFEFIRKK